MSCCDRCDCRTEKDKPKMVIINIHVDGDERWLAELVERHVREAARRIAYDLSVGF